VPASPCIGLLFRILKVQKVEVRWKWSDFFTLNGKEGTVFCPLVLDHCLAPDVQDM
jgi:hypothetical protein